MNWTYTRRWLGLALVLGGAGLTTVHYIDYGWTAHLAFPDHGLAGIVLVLIGGALGLGKPGTRATPPGVVSPPPPPANPVVILSEVEGSGNRQAPANAAQEKEPQL